MTITKSIRISETVFNMIGVQQLPRESISETMERLLKGREFLITHARAMVDALRQQTELHKQAAEAINAQEID